MPIKTGGTVKQVKRSAPGPVFSAIVTFPPPTDDVTYAEISRDDYDDFRAALGKPVVVDVETDAGGAITKVTTRKP